MMIDYTTKYSFHLMTKGDALKGGIVLKRIGSFSPQRSEKKQ